MIYRLALTAYETGEEAKRVDMKERDSEKEKKRTREEG